MTEASPLLRFGIVRTMADANQEEAINCFDQLPNSPCDRPGFEVEIIDAIAKLLNWNYTWVIAEELGAVKDGSVTGLIGMVHRGEVDIGASTVRFLPERMALVNFAYPIWYYKQVFTIVKPKSYSYRYFAFTPFDPYLWLLLAISVLLCVLVNWAVHCLLLLRDCSKKQKELAGIVSLQNYFGMLLQQNVNNLPTFASSTTMVCFYAFFCLILTNYYKSIMTGMLAVPLNPHIPFRTIETLIPLLETKERSLVYFYDGYEPTYPDSLKERFKASLVGNPIRVLEAFPDLLDTVVHHGGVYFGAEYDDKIPFQVSDSQRENNLITIRDDSIAPAFGSFTFPKNSTYLKHFNTALITILPGVNFIKGRYKAGRPFPTAENSPYAERITLTLDHLWEIFTIWLVGLSLAFLGCLLELYGWRQEMKRIMANNQRNAVGILFSQINRLQMTGGRRAISNRNTTFSIRAAFFA